MSSAPEPHKTHQTVYLTTSPPELKFRAKVGRQFCVRARRDEGAGWAPVTEEQRSHGAKGPANFVRNFGSGGLVYQLYRQFSCAGQLVY